MSAELRAELARRGWVRDWPAPRKPHDPQPWERGSEEWDEAMAFVGRWRATDAPAWPDAEER